MARVPLDTALASIGLGFEELRRRCSEIVLFGSKAAGLDKRSSDWDLLCVGTGRPRSTWSIDLLWLEPQTLTDPEWLNSELAAHVARWGKWLHGSPRWIECVRPGEGAVAMKSRRIASRATALAKVWSEVPLGYQRRHFVLLRRDLQRHVLLARGEPVPPNALLDEAFAGEQSARGELVEVARRHGVNPRLIEYLARASV